MRNAKRTCNRAYPIQQSHVHTLWQWYVPVHDNAASILRASFFYKLLLLAARMQHAAETRSIQRAATYIHLGCCKKLLVPRRTVQAN